MEDVTAEEFVQLVANKNNFKLLDVRENLEFHTFNIGGLNIPLGKLASIVEDEDLDFAMDDTIIVICQRGLRSKTAKLILEKAGYKKVRNLNGGLIKLQRIS